MPTPSASTKKTKHDELLQKAIDLKFNKNFMESEKILKKIIKENPKNENALLELAETQNDTGRQDAALNTLAKIVKINPSNAIAWRHMGYIELAIRSNLDRAMEFLSRSLNANPADAETYRLMGLLCQHLNHHDDAIEMFEVGLQLNPQHPEMLSQIGMSLMKQRHFERAKEKIVQSVRLKPQSENIVMNAMRLDDFLGLKGEQKKVVEDAIKYHINKSALSNYIHVRNAQQLIEQDKPEDAIKTLENINENQPGDTMLKYFQLGKAYRKLKNHDKAFEAFQKGNEVQANLPGTRKFKKEVFPVILQREIKVLTEEYVTRMEQNIREVDIERSYNDPVFLIGFPRSGTTLSGQILDNHPDIITTDEYGAMDITNIHFQQRFNKTIPLDLDKLTHEELQFMHDLYNAKQSNEPVKNKDKVFVDKMPLNCANVTTIHRLFPQAKILFAQRHPLDSILSGYMQCFSMNSAMAHFNSIENMAIIYKLMIEAWERQKSMLPIAYHEYKYENVVNNFDEEAKKILEFLGVKWDPAVKDFHKKDTTEGPKTLTPSRTQVRKGLYKTAQNRWKKYEEHLKPAIDILGDTIEKLGYEI